MENGRDVLAKNVSLMHVEKIAISRAAVAKEGIKQ